jgi:hypothetical protein
MAKQKICESTGKYCHTTKGAAQSQMSGLNNRCKLKRGQVRSVYRCDCCGAWHIGREAK